MRYEGGPRPGRTERMLRMAVEATGDPVMVVGHNQQFVRELMRRALDILGEGAAVRHTSNTIVREDGRRIIFVSASEDESRFRGLGKVDLFVDHSVDRARHATVIVAVLREVVG